MVFLAGEQMWGESTDSPISSLILKELVQSGCIPQVPIKCISHWILEIRTTENKQHWGLSAPEPPGPSTAAEQGSLHCPKPLLWAASRIAPTLGIFQAVKQSTPGPVHLGRCGMAFPRATSTAGTLSSGASLQLNHFNLTRGKLLHKRKVIQPLSSNMDPHLTSNTPSFPKEAEDSFPSLQPSSSPVPWKAHPEPIENVTGKHSSEKLWFLTPSDIPCKSRYEISLKSGTS